VQALIKVFALLVKVYAIGEPGSNLIMMPAIGEHGEAPPPTPKGDKEKTKPTALKNAVVAGTPLHQVTQWKRECLKMLADAHNWGVKISTVAFTQEFPT
jgi:hypothetical protein